MSGGELSDPFGYRPGAVPPEEIPDGSGFACGEVSPSGVACGFSPRHHIPHSWEFANHRGTSVPASFGLNEPQPPADEVPMTAPLGDDTPDLPAYETVDHPKHYNDHPSGVECIAIVQEMTFNTGTAVKHLWRAGLKPGADVIVDLRKARQYILYEIERLGGTP